MDDSRDGSSQGDPNRARLDAAWKVWIDSQEAAIETVRTAEGVPRTTLDEAEGYRWITRLVSLAQEWFIEKSDPLHPQLFQSQTEYRKLLVDNPDVRYGFCTLDETRTYRLVGTRGEAAYIGLTFGTPVGKGPVDGKTGTTVQAHIDQFELGPNGEVDILIVPVGKRLATREENCVEMTPGTGQLAVRETFFDRRVDRPADLRVELVEAEPPPVLGVEELAGKLEFAGVFVQFVAATAVNMWHDTADNVNTFGGTAGAEHVAAQDDEVLGHAIEFQQFDIRERVGSRQAGERWNRARCRMRGVERRRRESGGGSGGKTGRGFHDRGAGVAVGEWSE